MNQSLGSLNIARPLSEIPQYIYSGDKNAPLRLKAALSPIIKALPPSRPLVILCIGTDRVTGDALGPLVGYKLERAAGRHTHVYGTLQNPVHARNLIHKIEEIYTKHANPFVIAIDACLGHQEHIGYITIGYGALEPGAGVRKKLPKIGDVSITGIVNYYSDCDHIILQNTRLNIVMQIADAVSAGLRSTVEGRRFLPSLPTKADILQK